VRDPDMVLRAQQAAAVLERAWDHWRTLHGVGAGGALPPVSSYVGYSLEEPWGQPRVVFGVAAEEAEQLAALLERSGYGGGGASGGATVATAPPVSTGVVSTAPTVVPAMLTSSQGVTLKVIDNIKEALKDAKDTQRDNRNRGRN